MGDYNNPNDNNNQQNQNNPYGQQNGQPGYQQPLPGNQPGYQQNTPNQNGYQQNNQNPYPNNQYQYGQYQQYPTPEPPKSNGMAVGSLICGILGILLSCCLWYIAIPLSIAGLVLGILVLKNKKGGKSLAIVGIVLSAISIIIGIFAAIMFIAILNDPEFGSMYQDILQEFQTTY